MIQWLVSAVVALASAAQQPSAPPAQPPAPPSTDVFVAALSTSGGRLTIGKPENISQAPGYDNQPFFAPDGNSLFFTSDRAPRTPTTTPVVRPQSAAEARDSSQMDIFRYDFKSRQISRVTETNEGEYSPNATPDGKHLSVIRVEADGTQRLWKFQLNGKNPSLVLENVKPVGYHAWLDAHRLALFVLGEPATLQLADARTGATEIVTSRIGRSIQKVPGGGISFVQQEGQGDDRKLIVSELTFADGKRVTRPLVPAVAGARDADLAWTPDGTLLMAHAGSLYAWKKGQTEWRVVADLGALGLKNVSRLAVSPKGDRIAMVGSEATPPPR
jgi:hypothetical protein